MADQSKQPQLRRSSADGARRRPQTARYKSNKTAMERPQTARERRPPPPAPSIFRDAESIAEGPYSPRAPSSPPSLAHSPSSPHQSMGSSTSPEVPEAPEDRERTTRELMLFVAVSHGRIEEVQKLLADDGSLVYVRDTRGSTPLHHAALRGHLELVKLLITEKSADVNAINHMDSTPLHLACRADHVDVARELLQHGSKVHGLDKQKHSPVDLAVAQGSDELQTLLLDAANETVMERENELRSEMQDLLKQVAEVQKRTLLLQMATPLPPISKNVVCLGLDGSGKTTLIWKMGAGKPSSGPTQGSNKSELHRDDAPPHTWSSEPGEHARFTLKLQDVGGGSHLRPYWVHFLKGMDAVLFVVDASDPSPAQWAEASAEVTKLLEYPELAGKPFVVLLNKVDSPSAVSEQTAATQLPQITDRPTTMLCVSALSGSGVGEMLDWLWLTLAPEMAARAQKTFKRSESLPLRALRTGSALQRRESSKHRILQLQRQSSVDQALDQALAIDPNVAAQIHAGGMGKTV